MIAIMVHIIVKGKSETLYTSELIIGVTIIAVGKFICNKIIEFKCLFVKFELFTGVTCIVCLLIGVSLYKPLFIQIHMYAQLLLIGFGILLTVVAVISMAGGLTWADAVFGQVTQIIFI